VLLRKIIEGHHPIPVAYELLNGLRIPVLVSTNKGASEPLTSLPGLGIGDLAQIPTRLMPDPFRKRIQNIRYLMVPASLFASLGIYLSKGPPDAAVTVSDHPLACLIKKANHQGIECFGIDA
jgi:hypothetical protein